jgi:hypothetical protein
MLSFIFLSLMGWSGSISLKTDIKTESINEKIWQIQIQIENNGSESAHKVQPKIIKGDSKELLEAKNILPQGAEQWELSTSIEAFEKGQKILAVLISYQDANGYSFSVPAYGVLSKGEINPELQVISSQDQLSEKEYRLYWSIKNLSNRQREFQPQLTFPDELELLTSQVSFKVQPMTEMLVSYDLKNKSALVGSSYNIVLVLEEMGLENQKVISHVESQVLRITGRVSEFKLDLQFILSGLLALYFLLGLLYFKYRHRSSLSRH